LPNRDCFLLSVSPAPNKSNHGYFPVTSLW
jgi:hypothetical protein